MGSMALGLFASLLIGTIFKALGMIPNMDFLVEIGNFASAMAGPAMAVAIAYSLKAMDCKYTIKPPLIGAESKKQKR